MTKTCTWKMSSAEIHLTFILHFGLWIRAVAALMLFWPLAKAGWARLQQQCISNCAAPIGVKRHSLRWTAMGSEKCTWPCPALSEVASLSCMPQFSAWHFSPVTILPHLAPLFILRSADFAAMLRRRDTPICGNLRLKNDLLHAGVLLACIGQLILLASFSAFVIDTWFTWSLTTVYSLD